MYILICVFSQTHFSSRKNTLKLIIFQERIGEAKDEITGLIRENTNRLDSFNMLFVERKDFEVGLDSRQKNLVS